MQKSRARWRRMSGSRVTCATSGIEGRTGSPELRRAKLIHFAEPPHLPTLLRRLKEVNREDGDERFERVAEARMHSHKIVGEREQQKGPREQSRGRDAAPQSKGE